MFLLSPWAMEFVFVILKSIRGFARVEVFAWSGGPRCRCGWMLMDDPIDPGKQVDIPWYTPRKEATKKNISDIRGPFYPTSTFKTRLWLCFFVDLTSFLMQHYESDKPPTICIVWGAIHLVWRLPVFWNPKNVMSRCDGVGRQDIGCTARVSFSCGVRETLTFTHI